MNIIEAMEQLKAGKAIQRTAGATQKFRQCSWKMDSIRFLHLVT